MNFMDLANLLDNDGNLQNEMMVMAFAATLLSTIPVLLGNEFDVNVGLKRRRKKREDIIEVSKVLLRMVFDMHFIIEGATSAKF